MLQPIIFTVMFTYIFGGAISGNVHAYLPVIIPGILVQTVIVTSVVTGTQLREDMDRGYSTGSDHCPSLVFTARRRVAGRRRATAGDADHLAVGIAMGWRPDPVGVIGSTLLVLVCSFAVSWIFALMGCLMSKGPRRAGRVDAHHVPADVHVERLRAGGHDARLAQGSSK